MIDSVKGILASQKAEDMGIDLTQPVLAGLSMKPEGVLVRFSATNPESAKKGVDAVIKELAHNLEVHAHIKGDALWLMVSDNARYSDLKLLLEADTLSKARTFPRYTALSVRRMTFRSIYHRRGSTRC